MNRNLDPERPAAPMAQDRQNLAQDLAASPEFRAELQALVGRRRRVTAVLLGILFTVYYGFILLIPYARELLAWRVGTATTLAIAAGTGVILVSIFLTWAYVGWTNQSHDPAVERLRRALRR